MSPFVACCLLPASAIARCCWFKPCVLSLCRLNLYIHNSTLPHALIRALRSSTLIRFLSVFPLALSVICFSNVVSSISRLSTRAPPAAIDALCSLLFLMSCRASYVCALCYDRCALDVFCFFSIFLSSFNPCVIAFVIRRTFTVTCFVASEAGVGMNDDPARGRYCPMRTTKRKIAVKVQPDPTLVNLSTSRFNSARTAA
jgi:hypothetical protein